eukprot:227996-Hanusia_phi.AAC.1
MNLSLVFATLLHGPDFKASQWTVCRNHHCCFVYELVTAWSQAEAPRVVCLQIMTRSDAAIAGPALVCAARP